MHKILLTTATLSLVVAGANAAQAQSAPSGPRVELQLGVTDEEGFDLLPGEDLSHDGFFYGIGTGYDVSLGKFALGIDLEAGRTSSDIDYVVILENEVIDVNEEIDAEYYLGGRVTVPVGMGLDAYAKAGYLRRETSSVLQVTDSLGVIEDFIEDGEDGYRLGAGARISVLGLAYVGGEYRYTDFGEFRPTSHQLVGTLGVEF